MKKQAGNGEEGCVAIAMTIVLAIIAVGVMGALMVNVDTHDQGATRGDSDASEGTTKSTNETVLFEDDFEDGNMVGWETQGATIQTGNFGEGTKLMQLNAETSGQAYAYYSNYSWSNYTVEATVEIGDSYNAWAEISIWFYGHYYFYDNYYNGYFIKLDAKNDTINLGYDITYDDGFSHLWGYENITDTAYLSVSAYTDYNIRISTMGQNIQVFVNDIKKFDVTRPLVFTSGEIGFEAEVTSTGSTNSTGWFKMNIDNVKVTKNNVVPVSGSVLFQDDFEDGNYNGWGVNHAYMQNGSLDSGNFMVQLQSDNASAYPLWNGSAGITSGLAWNNYQLELSIRMIAGWAFIGVYLPTANCYDVGMCPGYWLFIDPATDTVSMEGPQQNYPLNYNTDYDVRITIFSGNITVFIDDNMILTAYSTSISGGTIGIVAPTMWSAESTCYFDNVKVTQLDAMTAPLLTVEGDSSEYVPGDQVTLTASYLGMNSTKVVFKVDKPGGTALATQARIVPAGGSINFAFFLPTDATYGDYIVYATTYDSQAQTSFEVTVSELRILSMNVPDAQRNSTLNIAVTVINGKATTMNFILAVQVIDSNGVPLPPIIVQTGLGPSQSTTFTQSIDIPTDSPTGEYRVQAQILTGLPSEGGYALDFMNRIMVVS